MLTGEKGQRRLVPGSLPTEFLPRKSIETKKALPRRTLVRDPVEPTVDVFKYTELKNVRNDFKHIKPPWIVLIENSSSCIFGYLDEHGNIIHKVIVDESLEFSIESSALCLPDNHELYEKYKRTVAKVRIQWLLSEVAQLPLCSGIRDKDLVNCFNECNGKGQCFVDYGTTSNRNTGNIPCIRSNDCKILLGGASEENCCLFCKHVETELKTKVKLTDKTVDQELHPNTPLCTVSKDKLIKELKSSRKKEKELRIIVKNLEEDIQKNGACLNDELHKDFSNLISGIEDKLPEDSFEKLFWQEQILDLLLLTKHYEKAMSLNCLAKEHFGITQTLFTQALAFTRLCLMI